ncbi:MAG: hypothetical protein CSA50_04005 [Gammaproteobacteria bacterium]|nr:MAG: hypothetical protein CSA50_04005 [Gammaproteobacteria bacterium]
MRIERRTAEGSGLRKFFDDQLAHLGGLLAKWEAERNDKRRQLKEQKKLVESVVEGSDTRIRAVSGYVDKLRTCSCTLYQYVCQLAEQLPPPVRLNEESFTDEPLINALFANQQDITQLLSNDPALKDYLQNNQQSYPITVFAFLTAVKHQKTKLGMGIVNDKVVNDIIQETVNFSEHCLNSPCASKELSLSALKQFIFNLIIHQAKLAMKNKKQESDQNGHHPSNARAQSLNNPEVYLEALTNYLNTATKHLVLEKTHLRVSKLGIKLTPEDKQAANEFDLYQLCWDKQIRQVMARVYCPILRKPDYTKQMKF